MVSHTIPKRRLTISLTRPISQRIKGFLVVPSTPAASNMSYLTRYEICTSSFPGEKNMYVRSPGIALLMFVAALVAGCGCPTVRTEHPVRTEYIETGRPIKGTLVRGIQKKETTQGEIVQWFGAPAHRVATDDDIAYTYRHCKTKISTIDAHPAKETCSELFIVFDRPSLTVKDFAYAPRPSGGSLTGMSLKGRGAMP